jgi:hypothetical protein
MANKSTFSLSIILASIAIVFYFLIFPSNHSNTHHESIKLYTGLNHEDYFLTKKSEYNSIASGNNTYEFVLTDQNSINTLIQNLSKNHYTESDDLNDARYPREKFTTFINHQFTRTAYVIIDKDSKTVILQLIK